MMRCKSRNAHTAKKKARQMQAAGAPVSSFFLRRMEQSFVTTAQMHMTRVTTRGWTAGGQRPKGTGSNKELHMCDEKRSARVGMGRRYTHVARVPARAHAEPKASPSSNPSTCEPLCCLWPPAGVRCHFPGSITRKNSSRTAARSTQCASKKKGGGQGLEGPSRDRGGGDGSSCRQRSAPAQQATGAEGRC